MIHNKKIHEMIVKGLNLLMGAYLANDERVCITVLI